VIDFFEISDNATAEKAMKEQVINRKKPFAFFKKVSTSERQKIKSLII